MRRSGDDLLALIYLFLKIKSKKKKKKQKKMLEYSKTKKKVLGLWYSITTWKFWIISDVGARNAIWW